MRGISSVLSVALLSSFITVSPLLAQGPVPGAQGRLKLTVLPFESQGGVDSGEALILGKAFEEALFALGDFSIIAQSERDALLKELAFQLSGATSEEGILELGRLIGAQRIVAGSVGRLGGSVVLSARIIDIQAGLVTGAGSEMAATVEALLPLLPALAKRLGRAGAARADEALGMVLVPGGSFLMGSPDSEPGRDADEGPRRKVSVSSFYMGKYEVSFDEYDAFCAATARAKPDDNGFGRGRRPVINVSWLDAVAYCNWLSAKEGYRQVYTMSGTVVEADLSANGYRLPTEAEWEYACRAGSQEATTFGSDMGSTEANFDGREPVGKAVARSYYGRTSLAGIYPANAFGIYDMHGNVWELCNDWYGSYPKGDQKDPPGPPSGASRVARGGSYGSPGVQVRSANRGYRLPGYFQYNLGFRIARRP